MKKTFLTITILGMLLGLLTACSTAAETDLSIPESSDLQSSDSTRITIYSPMSTSSIPVILAAAQFPEVDLVLYTNQSQANTEFLRGDADLLVSGLSVSVDLYRNGAPVQTVNSLVSGLSYLVTTGSPVTSISDLAGKSVYVPFEGSPIDEIMAYLAKENGLEWKQDIQPVYSPFDSSIDLLKQGEAEAVVLPEPSVTLVEDQPGVSISLDLFDEWNRATGSEDGYPQVVTLVNPEWADENSEFLAKFNQALENAILSIQDDPEFVIEQVKDNYKLTPEKLLKSMNRTRYSLLSGADMRDAVETYYQTIGKPLDENFTDFYFIIAY